MRRSRWMLVLALPAALCVTILTATGASGAPCDTPDRTWTGGAGTTGWHTAGNWSPSGQPVDGDAVCIPGTVAESVVFSTGTVALAELESNRTVVVSGGTLGAGAATVAGLEQTNGVLAGPGTITVTGTATWSGGTWSGGGTVELLGSSEVSDGSLSGRGLVNAGTVVQTGLLNSGDGATIDNVGTWELADATDLVFNLGGVATVLTNSGTVDKTAGAGTASVAVVLANSATGTVRSSAGTLQLTGGDGGGPTAGTLQGTPAAPLVLASAFTLADGALLDGASLEALLTVPTGATATGTAVRLTGVTLNGPGTLQLQGASTIVEPSSVSGPVTLANSGTLTQNAALNSGSAARIDNTGTWQLADTTDLHWNLGGAPTLLTNSGTIDKTAGVGTATISVALDNDGTVTSSAGTLTLTGPDPGTGSTGTFTVTAPAVLELAAELGLGDGASLHGTIQTSGTLTIPTAATATATDHTQTGGTLTGDGDLELHGTNHLTGGTHAGTGRTEVTASATLTIAGGSLSVRGLVNVGTVVQTGVLDSGDGATIDNVGTWGLGDATDLVFSLGGVVTVLTNSGTVDKTSGAGEASVGVVLANSATGMVRSSAGTLRLTGGDGGGPTAGTLQGTPAAPLVLASAFTLADGALLDGASLDALLTVPAGATATGTAVRLTGVSLEGPGTLQLQGASTIVESSSVSGPVTLANSGTLTQNAALNSGSAARIDNTGTWQLADTTDLLSNLGGAPTLLTNSGTIDKTTGAAAATISVALDNDGTVTSSSGTLTLTGPDPGSDPGTGSTGTFTATAPAVLELAAELTLGEGASLHGTTQTGGTLTIPTAATATATDHTHTGGTLTGAGDLELHGTNHLTGGTHTGTGRTEVMPAATAELDGLWLTGRYLANRGAVTSGSLNTGGGAVVANDGTWTLDGSTLAWNLGGGEALMLNRGVVEQVGASSLIALRFENDATVRVDAAVLTFTSLVNLSADERTLVGGTWDTAATLRLPGPGLTGVAATLRTRPGGTWETGSSAPLLDDVTSLHGGGTLDLEPGATLAVTGSVRTRGRIDVATGATLTLGGDLVQAAGRTILDGGTLDPAGVQVQGGRLAGTGLVAAPVTVTGGTVAPGGAPDLGVLTIDGAYDQAAPGRLLVRVRETGQDQLDAVSATLGGELVVDGVGFVPADAEQAHVVVTDATPTGAFGTVTGIGLPTGTTVAAQTAADGVRAEFTVAGGSSTAHTPDEQAPGAAESPSEDPGSSGGSAPVAAIAVETDPIDASVSQSTSRFPGSSPEAERSGQATRRPAHAVVARGDLFADALAGTALTGDGPLLFTGSDALAPAVRTELDRLFPEGGRVYLLGGEAALSTTVEDAVTAAGHDVVRLAGPDRIATALAVADTVRQQHPDRDEVLLARATGTEHDSTAAWADSVAAGGAAAISGTPVLLTPTDHLDPDVAAWLTADGTTRTTLVGGPAALSAAVETAVPGPLRLSGADRAATAALVADGPWWPSAPEGRAYLLSSGNDVDGWAFGLLAAGIAADEHTPLLLVGPSELPWATHDRLRDCATAAATVVGPDRVVPADVRAEVEQALTDRSC